MFSEGLALLDSYGVGGMDGPNLASTCNKCVITESVSVDNAMYIEVASIACKQKLSFCSQFRI